MSPLDAAIADLVEAGRVVVQRGLVLASAGNLSARPDESQFVVAASGTWLDRLGPDDFSVIDTTGQVVSGNPRPSVEWKLHHHTYAARADTGAIVHLHSTHSAAVSCMCGLDPANCIPPLTPYFIMKIGRLPLVPYHRPGDKALGDAIKTLAPKHSAVLLANHCPVVSGPDLEGAIYASEELEETAKIFLLLQNAKTNCLNAEQIEELKVAFKLDI